jgi:hypothetical protein
VTFRISLDSSILISHLAEEVHKDEVLAAIGQLDVLKADVFLSLLCYAEVWTGIELIVESEKRQQAAEALHNML